jgi:hypothetical protein
VRPPRACRTPRVSEESDESLSIRLKRAKLLPLGLSYRQQYNVLRKDLHLCQVLDKSYILGPDGLEDAELESCFGLKNIRLTTCQPVESRLGRLGSHCEYGWTA